MKIAIITSGGDAPGMNACIRSIVRYSVHNGIEVCGFYRGYQGILDDDYVCLDRRSVSNIIQHGGTFLQTDRCLDFLKKECRIKAGEILKSHGVDSLIVIGGDGSFQGASALTKDTGINVVGIPGTIDNDLAYTDFTLGFDTAVNTVLDAINKLRDTMQSHNKVTVVEVMGRRCGDLALHAGITGGAEYILVPEVKFSAKAVADGVLKSSTSGKKSNLIVIAEGAGKMEDFCAEFTKYSDIVPRQSRLGHIQRGGSPTYKDRLLATRFGIEAVNAVMKGETNRVIGIRGNKIIDEDIQKALSKKKRFDKKLYLNASALS